MCSGALKNRDGGTTVKFAFKTIDLGSGWDFWGHFADAGVQAVKDPNCIDTMM